MVKDLRKAALGYIGWKQSQSHFRKPWRNPEDITVPRILIADCSHPDEAICDTMSPPTPSTPIAQPKPAKLASIKSNGESNSSSASNTPKKTKKKFKFKFDK